MANGRPNGPTKPVPHAPAGRLAGEGFIKTVAGRGYTMAIVATAPVPAPAPAIESTALDLALAEGGRWPLSTTVERAQRILDRPAISNN